MNLQHAVDMEQTIHLLAHFSGDWTEKLSLHFWCKRLYFWCVSVLMVQAWRCDRCGHTWLSGEKPRRCSKCKSAKWDDAPAASQTPALISRAVEHAKYSHDKKSCRIYGCLVCKEMDE